MILHLMTRKAIEIYGKEIICNRKIFNILNDWNIFRVEDVSLRNIFKSVIDNYGERIYALSIQSVKSTNLINKYIYEFIENFGIVEKYAIYVFYSLAYGIGVTSWKDEWLSTPFSEMPISDRLKNLAFMYWVYGFNIYNIEGSRSDGYSRDLEAWGMYDYTTYYTGRPIDTFKNPASNCNNLEFCDLEKLLNINWNKATGIGVFTGYNDIVALDFDYLNIEPSNRNQLISNCLLSLGLPLDYPWIINSASNYGFHIIFRIKENKQIDITSTAFRPTINDMPFERVDLIWRKNLVLPPSITRDKQYIEYTGEYIPKKYSFLHNQSTIPPTPPLYVDINSLDSWLNEYCGEVRTTFLSNSTYDKCYTSLYGWTKQSAHHDSMGGYCSSEVDKKWIKYCTSQRARISYGVLLAKNGEYLKAQEIFKQYEHPFAIYNLACLYALRFLNAPKEYINKLYEKIKNCDSIGSYERHRLEELINYG